MNLLKKILRQAATLLAIGILCVSCSHIQPLTDSPWKPIQLPTESNIQDLTFTSNPQHGWVVGSDAAILETNDGGKTWENRKLELDSSKYRFTSISFAGDEGWIVGEPAILLHTKDAGKSWERIALSSKLPGIPATIKAIGENSAEMTTDIGAIYATQDAGKNWKSLVSGAVGVFRTINRSPEGKYVAVSAKGNFYSTWAPGQESWEPHNRNSSRRVSNMGFADDDRLWMLARGGQLQFSSPGATDKWEEEVFPAQKTNIGLLDLAYRTPGEVWVSGGSGDLLVSTDSGKTWLKDSNVEQVPSNLYKILFFSPDRGFIIGQRGIILKYQGEAA
ncbi:photosynthesis system II assembly factor Ycf48 [Chamaesiphon minutus]|uniref:Photosystem II assembly protein Ycf48 n=1 Tax=Chamaesiphon minutus (strain ATCC 27169 / PCC 6605) TaxID=1173020 RepID=K9UMS6_CHAP6|nr:photosynthesis system II assembly factor Ycf48 [Chamaesiphon minutus]AFY95963.1 putative photosystem II stability/assembly factor-like protein [Chamaesiphon minutus PCC 6605]